jgi:hypothetical protein
MFLSRQLDEGGSLLDPHVQEFFTFALCSQQDSRRPTDLDRVVDRYLECF